jgi:leucyl aminopeptidase
MNSEQLPEISLTLRLSNEITSPPEQAHPLRVHRECQAWLRDCHTHLELSFAYPNTSVINLRWGLDQALRHLCATFRIKSIIFEPQENFPSSTSLSVALDLHNAFRGKVQWDSQDTLSSRFSQLAEAEDLYRTWINEDPSIRTSVAIANDIQTWAESHPSVSLEILEEQAIKEHGLNLLWSVGKASPQSPPRLIMARYQPADSSPHANQAPRMLLGKGITFDSGGINLKPYESFVSMMKNDMGGSALAWSLFKSLVEQNSSQPWVLVIPTCENAIGENAMRPGSIVQSHRGHRVRIDHTDAEGRLIMADALSYASERFRPQTIYTFATLTTAALIAYGPHSTPVHFADSALESQLSAIAEETGEDFHFFPFRLWHQEANRDLEADLTNRATLPGKASSAAGSRNAAHFLRFFTDAPLVHFDIFASTWNWGGDSPGSRYGATGTPLRSLFQLFSTYLFETIPIEHSVFQALCSIARSIPNLAIYYYLTR